MLSDRCLSCPVCPVCETVGLIKMPLGTEAGRDAGHSVLDGTQLSLSWEDPNYFGGMNVSQQRFDRAPRIKIWQSDAY